MKKLILLITLLLAQQEAFAQIQTGAIAGINRSAPSSSFSGETSQGNNNSLIGWNFGLKIDWDSEAAISFSNALQFQRTGLSSGFNTPRTVIIDYLSLPIWVKLKLNSLSIIDKNNRAYILAGGYAATPLSSRVNYQNTNISAGINKLNPFDYGWSAGIGTIIKSSRRLIPLELIYFSGLADMDKGNKQLLL